MKEWLSTTDFWDKSTIFFCSLVLLGALSVIGIGFAAILHPKKPVPVVVKAPVVVVVPKVMMTINTEAYLKRDVKMDDDDFCMMVSKYARQRKGHVTIRFMLQIMGDKIGDGITGALVISSEETEK